MAYRLGTAILPQKYRRLAMYISLVTIKGPSHRPQRVGAYTRLHTEVNPEPLICIHGSCTRHSPQCSLRDHSACTLYKHTSTKYASDIKQCKHSGQPQIGSAPLSNQSMTHLPIAYKVTNLQLVHVSVPDRASSDAPVMHSKLTNLISALRPFALPICTCKVLRRTRCYTHDTIPTTVAMKLSKSRHRRLCIYVRFPLPHSQVPAHAPL